jgi:hypothetical protein
MLIVLSPSNPCFQHEAPKKQFLTYSTKYSDHGNRQKQSLRNPYILSQKDGKHT